MKQLLVLLSFVIYIIFSCGPSLESENASWKRNIDAANNLKTEYAAYKPLIDKKIDEATAIWNDAAKISKEDQKVKKMVEANNVLDEGCIGNLMHMKDKISNLKYKKESLMRLNSPNYQLESRAQRSFETVADAINKAEKVMYLQPSEFNMDEAPTKIDRAWNGLNDAYREVEIITDNINKENNAISQEKQRKEQKINDDRQKREQKVNTENQKKQEALKDIKCSYCGTMNPHNYTKCKSCGAPKQ